MVQVSPQKVSHMLLPQAAVTNVSARKHSTKEEKISASRRMHGKGEYYKLIPGTVYAKGLETPPSPIALDACTVIENL